MSPRDTVSQLRAIARTLDGQGGAAADARLSLQSLAMDLERWSVDHRHQLLDDATRATPSNLRLIAARLDRAAKALRRPFSSKRDAAAEMRANAEHLRAIAGRTAR